MTLINNIEETLQAIADAEGDASVAVKGRSVYYDTILRVEADPPEHALVFDEGDGADLIERAHVSELGRVVRVALKIS